LEHFVYKLIAEYHQFTYLLVMAATFIEGESIVILCGTAAHDLDINVELLALFAFAGSFIGDQLYYHLGRKYGAPLLRRWPTLGKRIDWAFRLVRERPTLFVLTFRFIYGVRNIAPFVIGIVGVPRARFIILNFIAAQVWAHSFAWGGYWLGRALQHWFGDNRWYVLGGFVGLALCVAGYGYLAQRRKLRTLERSGQLEAAESAAAAAAQGETVE
jgi:membrane protein DedA with SNARE-associated domain